MVVRYNPKGFETDYGIGSPKPIRDSRRKAIEAWSRERGVCKAYRGERGCVGISMCGPNSCMCYCCQSIREKRRS